MNPVVIVLVALVLMFGPALLYVRHVKKGWVTSIREYLFPLTSKVMAARPGDEETDVLPNSFIATDIHIAKHGRGLDRNTLTTQNIRLWRSDDRTLVDSYINTSGAGDAIVLQPIRTLDPNTRYTFEVTPAVMDQGGHHFERWVSTFTTSGKFRSQEFPAAFEKVALEVPKEIYIGITMGPDGRIYAGTFSGWIYRWDIKEDGTLTNEKKIDTLRKPSGPRLCIGLRFDPASTPAAPILWVTHGSVGEGPLGLMDQPDWSSKLSRLSGANLENYEDVVVGLPRSAKDHPTNQPDFGPDGCIYFTQGSNSAMGGADPIWANRPEHLLTAAMLRLDLKKLDKLPLDVKTEDGGTYNPFAPDAPLTIYATGIREGFDTVWHSNGKMYVGINGSAAGGNTPGTPKGGIHINTRIDYASAGPYLGPAVPELIDVNQCQMDFVSSIEKGKYYGNPNPTRGEFVLNGGNSTAGKDILEVPRYPAGTAPDRNYKVPDFIPGRNISPDGMIEYKSDAFGGALKGMLMVVRYSGGKDIIILNIDKDGTISELITGIEGMKAFFDPLDLAQDPKKGTIYVTEFGGKRITLLRPVPGGISRSTLRQAISPVTHETVR